MKKIIMAFISIILAFVQLITLVSCNYHEKLRREMLLYFSTDSNFVELTGIIAESKYMAAKDELRLEVDITCDDGAMLFGEENDFSKFVLVYAASHEYDICIDDTIVFVSAPQHFYNGHISPIVALQKGEIEYLSFEEGKLEYLQWIDETFDNVENI